MNFGSLFKNLTNFQFPYSLESTPYHSTPLWELYRGTRKRDSYPVTVFKARCDGSSSSQVTELIMNATRMCKIIRVPGICPVLDIFDDNGPDSIFIITEVVQPLQVQLEEGNLNSQGVFLGLFDLFQLLQIIDPLFIVGNICLENIFIDNNGRWVLFGLECCFERNPEKFDKYKFQDFLKIWKSLFIGIDVQFDTSNVNQIDSIMAGTMIKQIFEKIDPRVGVPTAWKKPINATCSGKLTMKSFISQLKRTDVWQNNELISIYDELRELHIKDAKDKLILMKRFESYYFQSSDKQMFQHLSCGFISNLIVPEIQSSIKWIIATPDGLMTFHNSLVKLLTILLDLIVNDERDNKSLDNGTKEVLYLCFKLTDRQIRFILLIYLPKLLNQYPKGTLEFGNRIFPFFLQGMADTDKSLRLQTLKTIPFIIPEISERQLNNEILRSIAKTQVDSDDDIRTWTVLIIVKISHDLKGISNRDNVLATIYTKSLKDPNVKTKLAALYGLRTCIDIFKVEVIANKVMSVIAPGLLDKDKIIRIKAKELFNLYLNKLEREANLKFNDDDADDDDATGQDTGTHESEEYVKEFEKYESPEGMNRDIDALIREFIHGLSISNNSDDNLSDLTGSTNLYETRTTTHTSNDEFDAAWNDDAEANEDDGNDAWGKFDDDNDAWGKFDDEEAKEAETSVTTKSSILNRPAPGSRIGHIPKPAGQHKKNSILGGSNLTKSLSSKQVKKSILSQPRKPSGTSVARARAARPAAPTVAAPPAEEHSDAADEDDAWDEEW